MLSELIASGYGYEPECFERGYNCAEKILFGANEVYGLSIDDNSRRMASGFGGGLYIENVCGGVCGAIMVISLLATKESAHKTPEFKETIIEEINKIKSECGSITCSDLKPEFFEQKRCMPLLAKIANILDDFYLKQQENSI